MVLKFLDSISCIAYAVCVVCLQMDWWCRRVTGVRKHWSVDPLVVKVPGTSSHAIAMVSSSIGQVTRWSPWCLAALLKKSKCCHGAWQPQRGELQIGRESAAYGLLTDSVINYPLPSQRSAGKTCRNPEVLAQVERP